MLKKFLLNTTVLFTAGALFACATAAYADEATLRLLRQEIADLKTRVATLEQRFEEGIPVNKAARVQPIAGGWREPHNWKLLESGMEKYQLEAVLDSPEDTRKINKFEIWTYPNGEVKLYLGRVKSWSTELE